MWWAFVKIYEDAETVRYLYACESHEPDGEITCEKHSKKAIVTKPSATTPDLPGQIWARKKFWTVIDEGFPDKRTVAIG
ncbi:hypothetical protein FACS1894196_4580 [Clostridia bacterium]|nr:hypothetical protein FACS1894196_4580 [Clostridia bacterium]